MKAAYQSNNHRLFASAIAQLEPFSEQTTKVIEANYRDLSVYASILLQEFKTLVEALAQLNENEFERVYPEVYSTIERLTHWFDETSSSNTIELYSSLRHLKQKVRKQNKRQKPSLMNEEIIMAGKQAPSTGPLADH